MKVFPWGVRAPRQPFATVKRLRFNYVNAPIFIKSRFKWAVRAALKPIVTVPCIIDHIDTSRYFLSSDRIDDIIFLELFAEYGDLFFPRDLRLDDGDIILDVGAHHGHYAVAALHRFKNARVICVEPDRAGFALLRRNIALNRLSDRTEMLNVAIGASAGPGRLSQSTDGSWGNRLLTKDEAADQSSPVDVAPLKDVLRGRTVACVKSNCEGGEFALFPQLFELGVKPRVIILCAHPDAGDVDALVDLVATQGYDVRPTKSSETHPRFVCVRVK